MNFVRQCSKRDPHLKTFHQSGFLVSRETVVLRRWKSERKILVLSNETINVELL